MGVKICGIMTEEAAKAASEGGADLLGFVFAESKRKITPEKAASLRAKLPEHIKTVGVFVNETKEKILEIADRVGLDYIQLHGDETPDFCESIPLPVIKAFSIQEKPDLEQLIHYDCEYILLDSPSLKYRGGSGIPFNWDLLKELPIQRERVILAGGLTVDNVNEAIAQVQPAIIDVSSGVETNGVKDIEKISAFLHKAKHEESKKMAAYTTPDQKGRYGQFGGRFVPETLMTAVLELEAEYEKAIIDPEFTREMDYYLKQYIGRETPLYFAENLTKLVDGPKIYLKREDLNHTGAHKINNTIGQALLTLRMGKKKVVAETGAGQHGVATATVCALLGLDCIVFMGEEDIRRQALNVFRMELLGAEVRSVSQGSGTLKDAVNEALRYWVANVEDTHYILGSVVGPHPFPKIVRDFQSVIGTETKKQMIEQEGKLPNAVIACIGGGSNAMGMFYPFIEDQSVKIYGVEAAGGGIETGKHAAVLTDGKAGVLHGTLTYLLQDEHGQIEGAHSISAGLDYPGVGPEHAHLKDTGRVTYTSATDEEALAAFQLLSKTEGIIPALESSHAVAYALKLAQEMGKDETIVICLSGRGDKDVAQVREAIGGNHNG